MTSLPRFSCLMLGTARPSAIISAAGSPSMTGMLGPYTSLSSKPTAAPDWARAIARFTATVLLPTPPLPDATAMMFLAPMLTVPRMRALAATLLLQPISTWPKPGIFASSIRAAVSITSLSGQAGVVSSILKTTLPVAASICSSLIMLSVTRSLCRSGSITRDKADITSCSVTDIAYTY